MCMEQNIFGSQAHQPALQLWILGHCLVEAGQPTNLVAGKSPNPGSWASPEASWPLSLVSIPWLPDPVGDLPPTCEKRFQSW